MGATSQNLKATITFAGGVDSSWKRSTRDVEKGLKDVDKESQKLIRDQAKLAAEIKKTKIAGNSVKDLSRQYSEVTREIQRTEKEQKRLNGQLSKARKLESFKGMGKGLFRRAGGFASGMAGMVAPGLAIGGGGVVASALGTLIMPAARNAETAEKAGIAKSYGVDVPTFNNWDSLAKQFGISGENVGDLFEEYLHKSGEYKQTGKQGALEDAFDTLGFKAGDMAGLSDVAQFEKIVERALSLKDQSKASFALDSLFGGEASKFLVLIRQSGKSYKDLIDEQQRYNLVTKEGADGAIAGNQAVRNLQTVFSSAIAEISGQLGNELAPDIRSLTDSLAEWFKGGGIKRITGFLKNDLYPGVLTFGNGVVYVGRIIYALAKKLSWLLPDDRNDRKDVLKSLAMTGSTDIARQTAKRNGQEEWFDKQLQDNPDLVTNVKKSYTETRGYFTDDNDKFNQTLDNILGPETKTDLMSFDDALKGNQQSSPGDSAGTDEKSGDWKKYTQDPANFTSAADARQLTDNRKFDYHFEINGAPGQDASAIGDTISGITKTNPAFTGDSSMYDLWSDQ
ncbi:AAA family ATPase [Dryocola clanedunensis]|uniref:hypothetical protein n=1 Tax=Cedecea sulfonylureivorans TaxID=3051154 RepID=UPI001925AEC4|nr:hypothetical protein [Cedecea sulfonylureivorans]